MQINEAKFIISNTDVEKCPAPNLPEYAFIGRSNVGKSSLINMLVGVKNLAKTSGTPGKTQLINHFLVNKQWYVADLPGYGFAKVSKSLKKDFEKIINDYILQRKNLMTVFVLIDIRHKAQANDLEFIRWLGEHHIPLALVFTKADKLNRQELKKNTDDYKKTLLESWEELPPQFLTSAVKRTGREVLLGYIEDTNKVFEKP